jgi:2-polyprenyl-6-methoxyphenol hydroxylase-like FAD-dependent oxidoreductase
VSSDPEVVVVGAGPVGLLLAVLLGRRGHRVDVLERQPRPYGRPRAVHIDHEAARILQSIGSMDELEPRTEAMDAYEWRNGAGAVLLRLEPPPGPAISGWPASLMFAQPDLELILETVAAGTDGVTVRRGWEVTGIEPHAGGAVVHVSVDGEPEAVTGAWVVGCDGAGSRVRDVMGAGVTDLGYEHDWLVVDVRPDEAKPWRPLNVQVCDPTRPTTAVSGGPGRRRFEFMRLPGESPETLAAEETAWRLLRPWDLTPANAAIERHATYTFGAALVDRWDAGRLVLAGDAAHRMPPFAGQGLCSGLRDAANLAWKLDLVLAGVAPERLVGTYGTERAAQVRTEIDFSVDLGRIICMLDPAEAAARDEGMLPAAGPTEIPAGPPLGPGVTRSGDPAGGQLSLQPTVVAGGRHLRLDDVWGPGWRLVGSQSDPGAELPAELAGWWDAIGGRSGQVAPGATLDDVTGRFGPWLAGLGATTVLIRPDFYLFGAGTQPAALVRDLRDAIGA